MKRFKNGKNAKNPCPRLSDQFLFLLPGGSLSTGELLAEVQREGILLPRCTLPLVRRLPQRPARRAQVRGAVPGLRRLQGRKTYQGKQIITNPNSLSIIFQSPVYTYDCNMR